MNNKPTKDIFETHPTSGRSYSQLSPILLLQQICRNALEMNPIQLDPVSAWARGGPTCILLQKTQSYKIVP